MTPYVKVNLTLDSYLHIAAVIICVCMCKQHVYSGCMNLKVYALCLCLDVDSFE